MPAKKKGELSALQDMSTANLFERRMRDKVNDGLHSVRSDLISFCVDEQAAKKFMERADELSRFVASITKRSSTESRNSLSATRRTTHAIFSRFFLGVARYSYKRMLIASGELDLSEADIDRSVSEAIAREYGQQPRLRICVPVALLVDLDHAGR